MNKVAYELGKEVAKLALEREDIADISAAIPGIGTLSSPLISGDWRKGLGTLLGQWMGSLLGTTSGIALSKQLGGSHSEETRRMILGALLGAAGGGYTGSHVTGRGK